MRPTAAPGDLALRREAWMELVRINKLFKETIKPLTDLEHVVEHLAAHVDHVVTLRRSSCTQAGRARRCS